MASKVTVLIASPDLSDPSYECIVELEDSIGPFNGWLSLTQSAFTIEKGTMTYSSDQKHVACLGGGSDHLFSLRKFDLNNPKKGQEGEGNNSDTADLPGGRFGWRVTKVR